VPGAEASGHLMPAVPEAEALEPRTPSAVAKAIRESQAECLLWHELLTIGEGPTAQMLKRGRCQLAMSWWRKGEARPEAGASSWVVGQLARLAHGRGVPSREPRPARLAMLLGAQGGAHCALPHGSPPLPGVPQCSKGPRGIFAPCCPHLRHAAHRTCAPHTPPLSSTLAPRAPRPLPPPLLLL